MKMITIARLHSYLNYTESVLVICTTKHPCYVAGYLSLVYMPTSYIVSMHATKLCMYALFTYVRITPCLFTLRFLYSINALIRGDTTTRNTE